MAGIPLATLHPYTLEFDAVVLHVNEDGAIELDQTYFYATSGGQPNDTGVIRRNDEEFKVTDVKKRDGHIIHVVDHAGLEVGDTVHCAIDATRRARLRSMHTATHVLCAVIERNESTVVTGNQIGTDRTRIDFNLEHVDTEKLKGYVHEANRIIKENPSVRRYVTTREELLANPTLVKLAAGFPAEVHEVHMVEIEGVDAQPCGGTHVDSLSEIGHLTFEKAESKGKNNRRVYFTMD